MSETRPSASSQRGSWQRTTKTKFREHLSFISTKASSIKDLKSVWSPVTPNDDQHRLFRPSSPPPPLPTIPIMPLVQFPTAAAVAFHQRPSEQEPDSDRTFSVQRAREEAAAKLEKGSKERQAERERLDREGERERLDREGELERKRQEAPERERAYQALERKRAEANWEEDNRSSMDDADIEQGSQAGLRTGRSINPIKSFSSKLLRLSHAVFKPSTPAPEPSSPFPRDGNDDQDERLLNAPNGSRVSSWLAFVPSRASHLHPWSPLHVQKSTHSRAGSEAGEGSVVHNHFYGNGSNTGTPRPISNAEAYSLESAHLDGKHKGKGRQNERCPACRAEIEKAKRRRSRWWLTCLFILLLLIIGNVIFINLYVIPKNRKATGNISTNTTTPANAPLTGSAIPSGTPTVSVPAATATTVSPAVQSCLTQFTSAAGNPASFTCSTCLPILSSVPNDFSPSLTSAAPVQGVGNVLQFCALDAINTALPTANSSALTKVGWLVNTNVCSWSGVACDSKGRVNSLKLDEPAVPQTIPAEFQYLVGLQTLEMTGNGQFPGGPIVPLLSAHSLTSLTLVETGLSATLTGLELSTSFPALNALLLLSNPELLLGGSTMAGITQMTNLTQLTLNIQQLPQNTLDILTNTGSNTPIPLSKTLQSLDMRNNGLSGVISAGLGQGLPNLINLHLDENVFASLPTANDAGMIFPPGLTSVTISGNTGMIGSLSTAQCDSFGQANIQQCDFTGTSVSVASGVSPTEGGCGKCKFS